MWWIWLAVPNQAKLMTFDFDVCSNRVICNRVTNQAGNIIPRRERRKVHAIFVGFFSRLKFQLAQNENFSEFQDISTVLPARNKRLMSKISKASIRKASKSRWTVCPTSTFTSEGGEGKVASTSSLAAMFWLSCWVQNSQLLP